MPAREPAVRDPSRDDGARMGCSRRCTCTPGRGRTSVQLNGFRSVIWDAGCAHGRAQDLQSAPRFPRPAINAGPVRAIRRPGAIGPAAPLSQAWSWEPAETVGPPRGPPSVRWARALTVTAADGVVAFCSKGVEREVERYDVLRRRPEIERGPVAVASQRLPVGHPYAQRRLPGTGVVERLAQRFGLEVPDPSAARRVHALLIPSRRIPNSEHGRGRANSGRSPWG